MKRIRQIAVLAAVALSLAACSRGRAESHVARAPLGATLAADYAAAQRADAAGGGETGGAGRPHESLAEAHSRADGAASASPTPASHAAASAAHVATPAPAAPSTPSAPDDAAASLNGGRSVLFALHLASYRSDEAAARGWEALRASAPNALEGLSPRIEVVDLGGEQGVFRRLKAGPLPNRGDAEARCALLQAAGLYCRPTDFTGEPPR